MWCVRDLCWHGINEESEEPVEGDQCYINVVEIKMSTQFWQFLRQKLSQNSLHTVCVKEGRL